MPRDHRLQGRPVDELADYERLVTLDTGVKDAGRAERGDLSDRGDLAGEARTGHRIPGPLGTQQLDRDRLAGRWLGEIDRSLAALA